MARGQRPTRVHVESILFSELPVRVPTTPDVAPTGAGLGVIGNRVACLCGAAAAVAAVVLVAVYVLDEVETADSAMEDLSHVPYPPPAPLLS